ncbi:MAG: enoyl-CoA hydratase/isomerase family protein [Flavobacteriaceae bacterium]|jgi:methylglutaconyl-CoA hydratase|nr:enoyl-CoA hydratase/isomerase family protein [Flavobacteriaceae bacterium]
MDSGNITTTIEHRIATISFYHPSSNSLPSNLLKQLAEEIIQLDNQQAVNIIILKSKNDTTFCAGASFDELISISNEVDGLAFFSGFANVINAMRKCSKLIIGRVQGKAVGGGVGLLAATDYCFATEQAAIKLSEFTIGIGPFVIAPAIERKMGIAALGELTINATQWHNAYWAKEKGLFARVFDSIDEMDQEIEILALKLANYNPDGLKQMKRVLWNGTDHWDDLLIERAAISGKLVLSDFTKEALKKFKK